MTPERIEELLSEWKAVWFGGQREMVRKLLERATREEHLASVNRITCTCDLCWSVLKKLEAERLA